MSPPTDDEVPLSAEDRFAIADVLNRHGHLFDEGHLDRLDEIFTRDVRYDLNAFGLGALDGIAAIREATLALGAANPVAHHVTNIIITSVSRERVTTRSKGLAVMSDGQAGSATYVDELRRENGRWRICRRTVLARRLPLNGSH